MADQPITQDHQKKLDDLKKATELATADAALADAKKKQLDAQKALNDATRAPTPEQVAATEQSAKAKSIKEVAEAETAAANARKAKSDADLAAIKAAIGEVPSSGITGAVTAGEKAGDLEAALLAMKAVKVAAEVVAKRIEGIEATRGTEETAEAASKGTAIVIMTPAETPTFQNVMAYNAQLAIINATLDDAITVGSSLSTQKTEALPLIGAAGLALDGISKLLSFFRTDISLNGVDVTIEDRVGLLEVANALTGKGFKVTAPMVYNLSALTSNAAFVIKDGTELSKKRADLAPLIVNASRKVDELTSSLAAATEPVLKLQLERSLVEMTALFTSLKNASALVDAWYTGLSAPDGKGVAAVVNVAKEKAIADTLQSGGLLLLVKVEKAGGGFMTKKNLWTFLRDEMPVYHMGGAAISFTAVTGADGFVKAAGVVPIHGGFIQAGGIAAALVAT